MIDGNAYINTQTPAPFQALAARLGWQSQDYYNMRPYPTHAFGPQQWPRDKGPLPTPLPYVETLINEGAEFVFRNGNPTFAVADNPEADELLQEIIAQNALNDQWISLAEQAGNQGTIACKFSVDMENKVCPIRLTFLDVPTQCRVWCDPHDQNRFLMARVQYPYRAADGQWYYFREEWTDTLHVTYHPRLAGKADVEGYLQLAGYMETLGDGSDWEIDQQDENPFGVIPITIIRNRRAKGNPTGVGDCWKLFPLVDRLSLTMHGEDLGNQIHAQPIPVAVNATISNTGPLKPGEPIEVHSDSDESSADFKLVEPTGAAREFSHRSMDRWEDLLYRGAGLSRVDPAAVTNKGNMTEMAFKMTYGRTIATCDQKRKHWGESGMAVLFRNLLLGLQRMGGIKRAAKCDEKTVVGVEWPNYFGRTDDDLQTLTNRTGDQVDKGFLPIEDGAERVLRAEGLPDAKIKELLQKLGGVHDAKTKQLTAPPQPVQKGKPE